MADSMFSSSEFEDLENLLGGVEPLTPTATAAEVAKAVPSSGASKSPALLGESSPPMGEYTYLASTHS